MTKRIGKEDVYFLNFGYEEDPPMGIPLEPSDEADRYPIQLYHRIASQVDVAGKDILEVSCGHGGAASYVMRTMHPASYTGLDYNPAAIEYCKTKHTLPGLKFVHGDAENLPFPDGSFDAVVNCEAGHLYPNFPAFLSEVARVLRPGGHFLCADLRETPYIAQWEADLAASKLRLISEENINEGVLRGLRLNTPHHKELINRFSPAFFRKISLNISGIEGGSLYKQVENNEIDYRLQLLVKD